MPANQVKQILAETAPVRSQVDSHMQVLSALGLAGKTLAEAELKSADPEQKLRLRALLALLRSEWKLEAARPDMGLKQ